MGANYSVVFSATNALGTAIAVGDLVIPSVGDPINYVVATTAALAGRRPEAVALTPVGARKGTFQIQQVGTIPASVSGYAGGESWVRCSAAGRIEACAANDPLLIGRAEADGRVHLLMALPLIQELPVATGPGVLLFDGTTITHLPVAGASEGDVLTLGLGLSIGWAAPTGGGGGGFNPATLPNSSATPKVWYDMGNSSNGGGVLTALPDKFGNGYTASIPGGAEPTFTASDAGYNNIATVAFPASNTKRIVVPNLGITTGPYTMVFVGDINSSAGYAFSNTGGVGGDQSQLFCINTTSTSFASKFNPGALFIANTIKLPTVKNVVVVVGNGATSKIYVSSRTSVNGNAGVHDLTGTTMMLGNYANSVNAAFSQNGKTAHALVYQGAMNQADVEYLLDGFGALAGITITA